MLGIDWRGIAGMINWQRLSVIESTIARLRLNADASVSGGGVRIDPGPSL
jgi:hypothetical protein